MIQFTYHQTRSEGNLSKNTTYPLEVTLSRNQEHKPTVMSANGFAFSFTFMFLLLLLCLSDLISLINGASSMAVSQGNESMEEEERMVPLMEEKMVKMVMNETRRKLNSFQICALCTCCGGAKGVCLPSPCCYAINCNIPNRPFGFCSFTPKTCNCFGCHL